MSLPEGEVRGRASGDGAQVGLGVELRDDQLDGDVWGLVLQRSEGDADDHFAVGWDHTWRRENGRVNRLCVLLITSC